MPLLIRILIVTASVVGVACAYELPDYPDDENTGVPVNYTEANVGDYTLPDPLVTESGDPVTSAEEWRQVRRPELHAVFESQQYGRAPESPQGVRAEVVEDWTDALDGLARRKQVTIHLGDGADAQRLDLLVYTPAERDGPAPTLLSISFLPNNQHINDPGVRTGRRWDREQGKRVPAEGQGFFGPMDVRPIVQRGYGFATFCYGDVDPDSKEGFDHGVRKQYLAPGATRPADDEWGTIAAWGWGISRVIDYFESDDVVDAKRVAITGISRLGKTVMWAGANDQRIAAVIASCSGEGGAALSRRDYGETIAHLASPARYAYQFAKNYQRWAPDPGQAPVDAHELVALIAPRPLLLQTGTTDKWSDPVGEFLAAKGGTPVYELLGESGVMADVLPEPDTLIGGTLSYYMHEGGHGMVPGDWEVYLDFLDEHLRNP